MYALCPIQDCKESAVHEMFMDFVFKCIISDLGQGIDMDICLKKMCCIFI